MTESTGSQNLSSTSKQQPSHEKICLETHTWHAKYFHMINKWGHQIPHYSNDKSLQASYDASRTELDLDSENSPLTDSLLTDEKLGSSSDSSIASVQSVEKMVIDENEADIEDLTIEDLKKKIWHINYYKKQENIEAFKIQVQMWQFMKVLGSPSCLPSNMIIGLTVLDPRFYLPAEKTIPESRKFIGNLQCQLYDLNRSPVWDAQIRHIVNGSCVSTNAIKELTRVPDMSNNPNVNKDAKAKIPILLVQKPASSLGLGSRIDIILPSRWAMAFWKALIMRSALVGGLRETNLVVFESLGPYVPEYNDPDTPAYKRKALRKKKILTNKYFSRLPNKRVNFIKFGISSPFFCDWKNLTKGWSDVEDFYVLRNLRLLTLLKTEINLIERKDTGSESINQRSELNLQEFDEYQNCLVQVQLSMVKEGTPKNFTIICIPTLEDLISFEWTENYVGPVETCHTDSNEVLRKRLQRTHWRKLKLLSLRTVIRKKTFQGKVVKPEKADLMNRAKRSKKRQKIISDYEKEMRKLYLPESKKVRHSCDREVMGYVTMGGYSISREGKIGIGYVTIPSLLQIICQQSNLVLIRNTVELQYRYARLKILVDIKS